MQKHPSAHPHNKQGSATMATTNTKAIKSSCALLLIAIVLAMASNNACADDLPPSPTQAPPLSPVGGRCKLRDEIALKVCVNVRLGKASPFEKDLCCRQIRETPSAADCLCSAFIRAYARVHVKLVDDINAILTVCGKARVHDQFCLQRAGWTPSLTGDAQVCKQAGSHYERCINTCTSPRMYMFYLNKLSY